VTITVVTDTAPVLHLAEIDTLDLLSLADELYVPETVYNELEAGGVPDQLEAIEYTRLRADIGLAAHTELDAGESAAMALAKEQDAILLTDDLAAREQATEWNIEVHGSIGLIAFGYSQGYFEYDEAVAVMRRLQRETDLFVTDAVVERGIEMLDER